jgi:RsiW-degrading membrane proteinase PrsW (M82 family)
MNSPANENGATNKIELRLRTMRTLWFALLMSIVMWYVFTLFWSRPSGAGPNNTLFLLFVGGAFLTLVIAFLIKNALVNKAIDQQQTLLVQQAYVVAWAVNEVGGLLAIVDFVLTGDRYYYVMLIIAGCGQLLLAPKRQDLVNASFKRTEAANLWQEPT